MLILSNYSCLGFGDLLRVGMAGSGGFAVGMAFFGYMASGINCFESFSEEELICGVSLSTLLGVGMDSLPRTPPTLGVESVPICTSTSKSSSPSWLAPQKLPVISSARETLIGRKTTCLLVTGTSEACALTGLSSLSLEMSCLSARSPKMEC